MFLITCGELPVKTPPKMDLDTWSISNPSPNSDCLLDYVPNQGDSLDTLWDDPSLCRNRFSEFI